MNREQVIRAIIIDNIYPILIKENSETLWPNVLAYEDKMECLDYIILHLEKFEEYDKCDEIHKIKRKLKEIYEQSIGK